MAKDIKASPLAASFDYELYEGDPDHLRTVVAAPTPAGPYIDPASIKLKHRIGRGYFGDVWSATHHQSATDYDENHEVAIKMLHPLSEDQTKAFSSKFEELWVNLKSKQIQGVCWLHGISVISGKICIAMRSYEESVGDKMARLKGGKLQLPDVLRYGIELAKVIQELHSMNVLVLNLKPTNFLLNEHDEVFLGDFGIPYLLLGVQPPDSDLALRLGTPNYMAPEQWEPEVRGPITCETDAWGFGCSIIEMMTGVQPWFGKSVQDMYRSVVINQEKPRVPGGLPTAIENVLNGCFEYDLRNRPLMVDILQAFESSKNDVYSEGEWSNIGGTLSDKSKTRGFTTWYLSKDLLQVGDTIRSRKTFNSGNQDSAVLEGTVVGLEKDTDRDGFVLVRFPSLPSPLRVNASTIERVTCGLAAGDWVQLVNGTMKHASVGILHSVQRDGSVTVGFLGLETLWTGHSSEVEKVVPFFVGQFVQFKSNVKTPRFEWPMKRGGGWATGRISQILPNGCLIVQFPGRMVFGDEPNTFLADPDEVIQVSFDTCPGIIEKYQHLEDFHWSIRPLSIAFSLFTAVKLGVSVGKCINAKLKKESKNHQTSIDSRAQEGEVGGKSAWFPPNVANILFQEGAATAR
ncbi:protein KINASE OF THE OUTER CHLOROPLAST MEMBRANE 1-like [Lycium barbarum]|uniref:protein KINASE OF THE OUTER CHLOROPLAST MEMBRANE 1-like n=1 Tax=Lycium barbarum TaxID=112863 RepID=UPI00293E7781|nr:protein KINASE OF THE OUTER CHLOROPLAST MEMBRANE 1-like [Lycium barbarum]XP_060196395.1 protein KINASE OF THE OUTER CHLOROPLAST MEMBRANE 1-like [Lycium barbarum]XP_060196396.1 protein KINASE OF THE OUTER CHLOROPLAST MEMBRANE 1-like [Lycium barbarum]